MLYVSSFWSFTNGPAPPPVVVVADTSFNYVSIHTRTRHAWIALLLLDALKRVVNL